MSKEEVLAGIARLRTGYASIPSEYTSDQDVMLAAIRLDFRHFFHCSETLQRNRAFLLQASIANPPILERFTTNELMVFYNDRNFISEVLQGNGHALRYINDDFKRDRELVKFALRQDGLSFRHVVSEFLEDAELAGIALAQNPRAMMLMPQALLDDEELINSLVKIDGRLLHKASERLQQHKPTVLLALAQNGLVLQFVHPDLKNDPDVISAALAQNGLALQYLLNREKDNETIVRQAMRQNPNALAHASPRLRSDYKFMTAMVSDHQNALKYAHDVLRKDRDFTIMALVYHREAYIHVHETLKRDLILSRLAKAPGDASMLLALLPLKKKLKEETNPTAKAVATQMIASLEDLIVSQIEQPTSAPQFKESIRALIKTARQPLEKLPWWQTVIDHFMTAVLSFIPGPHQKRTFLFFPNPNPLKKEMDEIQKSIEDDPTPPSNPV